MEEIFCINQSPKTLWEQFYISTLYGDIGISTHVYINFPVMFYQKVTSTNHIELEILDSYIILGMDWLHSYNASVNYRTRIAWFLFSKELVLFEG